MKKRVFYFFGLVLFLAIAGQISASAVEDNIPIQIQTTDSSGNVVTGTFNFTINISNSSSCTPVLYSNTTQKTTDVRGIVSYNLENVTLDFNEQYWFCYYRDGVLKDATKIARIPYTFRAKNISAQGVINDSNLNVDGYNITANYGFFSYLGSLLNRVTTLFVQEVNATGNINTLGNVSASNFFGNLNWSYIQNFPESSLN
ncbi:hypothetical protein DRN69_06475, partial [Candidatus Pacearchaeota archaeon]